MNTIYHDAVNLNREQAQFQLVRCLVKMKVWWRRRTACSGDHETCDHRSPRTTAPYATNACVRRRRRPRLTKVVFTWQDRAARPEIRKSVVGKSGLHGRLSKPAVIHVARNEDVSKSHVCPIANSLLACLPHVTNRKFRSTMNAEIVESITR